MTLAFVTGGSRGLGRATATGLRAAGIDLVLFGKDPNRLAIAAAELKAHSEVVDLENIKPTREVFQRALEKYGTPDILVLAHGVMSDRMSKTLRTNDDEWRRVMSINLDSVFKIGRAHV